MKLAPIHLAHYFVSDLNVRAIMSYNPQETTQGKFEQFNVDIILHPVNPEQDAFWNLELTIHHAPGPDENFPYEFGIKLVGYFEYSGTDQNTDKVRSFIEVNGASMLYGVAREIIRANTARGPWEGIMLPTVTFYEENRHGKTKTKASTK